MAVPAVTSQFCTISPGIGYETDACGFIREQGASWPIRHHVQRKRTAILAADVAG